MAKFLTLGIIASAWFATSFASPLTGYESLEGLEDILVARDGSVAPQVSQAQVNDFKYWSEYSAAAYCSNQLRAGETGGKVDCGFADTCPNLQKSDTKIYSMWYGDDEVTATGFVAADNTKKKIVIALRGSVGLGNWNADLQYFQVGCPDTAPGGLCELGFYKFWHYSRPTAMKGLEAALKDHPDYPIVISGHSLGGAAAVVAAGELRRNYKDVTLYTYGQPRLGDKTTSEYITKQGKNFRITHTSDIVPQLPWQTVNNSLFPCYKYPSMTAESTGNCNEYFHISPEYYITTGLGNKASTYKKLDGIANYDGNAANSFFPNIIAHIQYFQTNMYGCVLPLETMLSMTAGIVGEQDIKKRSTQAEQAALRKQAFATMPGEFLKGVKSWENRGSPAPPPALRNIQPSH